MEYYILKCYQEAKNRCSDVDQGFDRFEPKIKKIVIACLRSVYKELHADRETGC